MAITINNLNNMVKVTPTQYNTLINGGSVGGYVYDANTMYLVETDPTYPVGAVYISTNSISPASLFGGSWTQISADRTLWTITSGTGGNYTPAGLPNITGELDNKSNYGNYFIPDTPSTTSALNCTYANKTNLYGGSGSQQQLQKITFNASKSNSIYGNSTTVKPPAFTVYMWQRIS